MDAARIVAPFARATVNIAVRVASKQIIIILSIPPSDIFMRSRCTADSIVIEIGESSKRHARCVKIEHDWNANYFAFQCTRSSKIAINANRSVM